MGLYKYEKGFIMARIKASPNLKKLTLLYVEDEESIRKPFKMMIERYFKKVLIGTNGKEGLEIFKSNSIDIVVSDIKMPKMSGIDMAKHIKSINCDVPIIFTTAFGDRDYLKDAIDIGVEGYIIKPIDRNKLFGRLNFIGDSLNAKKEVEQYLKLVELLINEQKDGLVLFDKDFNIKLSNNSFKDILKSANLEITGNVNDLMGYCKDENGEDLTIDWFEKISTLKKPLVCIHKDNNDIRYFDVDLKEIDDNMIMTLSDITNYKIETENIKESSMIDELTGLYNRKKLDVLKNDLISKNICLIIFDIDNFKKINDTYGHLKGDEVLKELAKTVKNSLRDSDLVIRWGGEEFLIILENVSQSDIAIKLSEKLRANINNINIEGVGHFSCSFGVSCGFVDKDSDIDKILNGADDALYKAKRGGKNRVCF